jgi:hypothetical protein
MARGKFARAFFGVGQKESEAPLAAEEPATPAGWYRDGGSLRYFDGEDWTLLRAPLPPNPLTQRDISWAVFKGVLAALFLVWLGAQIAPDDIYLPVKFVVEELPEGF